MHCVSNFVKLMIWGVGLHVSTGIPPSRLEECLEVDV